MIEIGLAGGAIMFVAICQMWVSRTGLLRIAWNRRGISRLAAVVASIAGFTMCIGAATAISVLFMGGWLLALPASIVMFIARSNSTSTR